MAPLIGEVIGLAGAFALTRLIRGLLFGVTPTDFTTFIAVAVGLAAVALLATIVPARRAAKVDPFGGVEIRINMGLRS